MRWLYLLGGVLGALGIFVFMMIRTYARYRTVAESIGSTDIEWNVLLVVGGSAGIMMIPVGIGFGLMVAVAIHVFMERFHRGLYSRDRDSEDGSSWVIHRGRPKNSSDSL